MCSPLHQHGVTPSTSIPGAPWTNRVADSPEVATGSSVVRCPDSNRVFPASTGRCTIHLHRVRPSTSAYPASDRFPVFRHPSAWVHRNAGLACDAQGLNLVRTQSGVPRGGLTQCPSDFITADANSRHNHRKLPPVRLARTVHFLALLARQRCSSVGFEPTALVDRPSSPALSRFGVGLPLACCLKPLGHDEPPLTSRGRGSWCHRYSRSLTESGMHTCRATL